MPAHCCCPAKVSSNLKDKSTSVEYSYIPEVSALMHVAFNSALTSLPLRPMAVPISASRRSERDNKPEPEVSCSEHASDNAACNCSGVMSCTSCRCCSIISASFRSFCKSTSTSRPASSAMFGIKASNATSPSSSGSTSEHTRWIWTRVRPRFADLRISRSDANGILPELSGSCPLQREYKSSWIWFGASCNFASVSLLTTS
mmetsp:Transcript_27168/g.58531  ORF Transcript_27168/g.58531 Transcript_27168/m.58531 type:complete len:202 (-) Transcript_27168:763-1368(-)